MGWGQDSRNKDLGDPLKRTRVELADLGEIEAILEGKKSEKRFMFMQEGVREKRFDWKCQTEKDRDKWVKGLNQHREHYEKVVRYLENMDNMISIVIWCDHFVADYCVC